MYLSCELVHSPIIDLEIFWNKSLLVEIKLILVGLFYSPRAANALFVDALNKI